MPNIEYPRVLSDGAKDYGNGVIGPSSLDIAQANSTSDSLPTFSRTGVFEGALIFSGGMATIACASPASPSEAPKTSDKTNSPATASPSPDNTPGNTTPISSPDNSTPKPTASPTKEPVATPFAYPPFKETLAYDYVQALRTQEKGQIDPSSEGKIATHINALWDKYGSVLEKLPKNSMLDMEKYATVKEFYLAKLKELDFGMGGGIIVGGYIGKLAKLARFVQYYTQATGETIEPEAQTEILEGNDGEFRYGIKELMDETHDTSTDQKELNDYLLILNIDL